MTLQKLYEKLEECGFCFVDEPYSIEDDGELQLVDREAKRRLSVDGTISWPGDQFSEQLARL